MKHIIYIVLICVFTMSCKEQTGNFAVISGTINDKGIDSIELVNYATLYKKTIAVNNSTFNDTISIDKIRSFFLQAGKKMHPLYLQNGYNLDINIDQDLTYYRSISFSGVGAEVNNYYKDKNKFLSESLVLKGKADVMALKKNAEANVLAKIDKVTDSITSMLKNVHPKDENFIAFEKENLFWQNIRYKKLYHYHMKSGTPGNTTTPDKSSPDFLPEEDVNFKADNEDLFINSGSYTGRVMMYALEFLDKTAKNGGDVNENMRIINSMVKTINFTSIKDYFLSNVGHRLVNTKDQKISKTYFDYFTSKLSEGNYKKSFVDDYKKNQEIIKRQEGLKGTPSPKFADYENFAGGTTSLDDLKGKYVYIDVWATWCGPCKKEIPFLQKVEKKYHDKNIAFVSISVDKGSAIDAWRTMVTEKELTGIQLIADKAFGSQFIKDYDISAIPRFILIDPEGKIVSSDAPRPSDPDLVKLFDGLKM